MVDALRVCSAAACKHSSNGKAEATNVANWRVISARSLPLSRGANRPRRTVESSLDPEAIRRLAGLTSMGLRFLARSCARSCRSESPSRTPFTTLPDVSSALYLNAAILFHRGNAQHLFERRLTGEYSALSVRLNAGVVRTSDFEHCLLANAFMNSRSKRLVDLD